MSRRKIPPVARLLVSVIYREEGMFETSLRRISERFGGAERISEPFPFDRTEYYGKEMGAPLFRRFVLTSPPVSREDLSPAKLAAEEIENEFAVAGRRTVNVDPGLLADENFVLATGKNYSHRIYLRDGVFADLTLVFEKGEYRPLPWTYPDFASQEIRAYLTDLRFAAREARKQAQEGDG